MSERTSRNEIYRRSIHTVLIRRHRPDGPAYLPKASFSYRDRVATRYIQFLDYMKWGYE